MTKEIILNYLKKNKDKFYKEFGIVTLGLFGSYAKNSATKDSDIDIFYERDKNFKLNSGLEFLALSKKIAKELNVKKVDLVKLSSMNPIVKYYAKEDFIYVE
jgi:predicted nucleotidyltransferase